jgi:membrane-bound lytic murein transglycosylase F
MRYKEFFLSEIKEIRNLAFPVIFLFLIIISISSCRQARKDITDSLTTSISKYPDPIEFDLDKVLKRGSLIAIIDNSSTSYFLYKGRPMGYEYELLTRLCQFLNVRLELIITSDIDEAIQLLNNGQGDIIAFNMAVTNSRKEIMAFTEHHSVERQVLVQRYPENWSSLKPHQIEKQLIRSPLDLAGKEIYVRKGSAHGSRLHSLAEEIGGEIMIIEDFADVETETLIKKVANGDIDFTIADENLARVMSSFYSNIDINTPISFPQKIAWAIRKNAPDLLLAVNDWLGKIKKGPDYNFIYNKYFKEYKYTVQKLQSSYSSTGGNKISDYDDLIKQAAGELEWDWRLLAAQVYQESRFDVNSESWAGAIGIMQLLPETAELYGAKNPYDPHESIKAGVNYLKWLDRFWKDKVKDKEERIKFVLASYNVGQGHVLDAYRLAKKYNKEPEIWKDNVEYFIFHKSQPEFYKDEVVKQGYCRGEEPVNYVKEILERFELYKMKINS